MTPSELYAQEPERIDNDVEVLSGHYFNHIKEIESLSYYGVELNSDSNKRIVIKYYKDFDFDGRRFWRLASVWFDDKPIMIIQNAGREGDDHHRRFITDVDGYSNMVGYISQELIAYQVSQQKLDDIYAPDQAIDGLDNFYGNSLDGYFERSRY